MAETLIPASEQGRRRSSLPFRMTLRCSKYLQEDIPRQRRVGSSSSHARRNKYKQMSAQGSFAGAEDDDSSEQKGARNKRRAKQSASANALHIVLVLRRCRVPLPIRPRSVV